MANTYFNGSSVRCTATFSVAGVATDPDTVTFQTKTPAGTVTTYTYAAAQVVRDSVGVFHYDVDANIDGTWHYRFSSTGNAKAAAEGEFIVTSEFV